MKRKSIMMELFGKTASLWLDNRIGTVKIRAPTPCDKVVSKNYSIKSVQINK